MATETDIGMFRGERLQKYMEALDDSGFDLAKLDSLHEAAKNKEELVRHLHDIDKNLNGDASGLADILPLYRQENRAKREWTTWDYIKAPFKATWNFVKRNPKTSALVGAAAVGAVLYYTGWGAQAFVVVREWLQKQLIGAGTAQALEAGAQAAEAGKEAAGVAIEAGKEVLQNVPDVFVPPTPLPPLPTEVPGLDAAEEILKALEKTG